jgi:PAS domain S-box-containing protein
VQDSFYDRAYEQMNTLIKNGHVSNWDSFCFNKNGKIIPVEQTMFYSYDKNGNRQAVISISRDIRERKKAEKTIIDTKNFLGDVIRTSADGIMVTDTVGVITLVNEAVEEIAGYSKEDLLGKNIHDFMVVPDGELQDDVVERKSTAKDSVYYYESKWKGKNGRLIDLGMSVSTLRDYSGDTTGMVACVRDITDRKTAENKLLEYQNQLRCLASQLILTEEQERRRIATEIHDRIAQSLALAKIKLGALGMAVQSREKAKDVAAIRSLLEQSIKDTRSLIFDLSPPFLYEFGLEKALEWLLEDVEKQHGVRMHLEYSGSQGDYDDDVRVLLYQSIRELLINVVKHAKAKTATVSLDRNAQKVHVCVEDDGQGFLISPDGFQVSSGGGYGIFSIKERFQHLGGALTVDSRLSQGTRISLDLPLVQHGA